ncbi:ImmA/IrrE family metallo-endopeptidase [uncultured Amphritea sp.]|uniref:ImmA/IrrE family metallo-endopeptidase n=1 Tax=uncultured Amphritea sp. TaxID=981605 RepID=UPI002616D9AF|nr:ImmA/IrrE family metallo-endopeptidase [uncultured Amphritea sp.]
MKFKRQPGDILKQLGIYEPEDIDLDLVAYSLNADVKRAALSDCEGNIIGTDEKAIITVNRDADPRRQRFSLGHELGHWVNDRGKNLTYRCDTIDMRQRSMSKNNFRQQKEVRANQFSAELIMPEHIFGRYLNNLDITTESVNYLANQFNVSRTSAAIRFVEVSDYPCMIVCWDKTGNRRWFTRNPIMPDSIWPYPRIIRPREAFALSNGVEVDADKWIDSKRSEDYSVIESVFSNGYDILSLIWWKDESHLTVC